MQLVKLKNAGVFGTWIVGNQEQDKKAFLKYYFMNSIFKIQVSSPSRGEDCSADSHCCAAGFFVFWAGWFQLSLVNSCQVAAALSLNHGYMKQ